MQHTKYAIVVGGLTPRNIPVNARWKTHRLASMEGVRKAQGYVNVGVIPIGKDKLMTKAELIEQLAAKEHASWARWMKYLFSVCAQEPDGSVTIPAQLVERWQAQAAMDYEALTEREKQSDRNRVALIVPIIDEYAKKAGKS